MARRLERLPRPPGGRQTKYPWDLWLDGTPWQLLHGEDFTCTRDTFRQNARYQAKSRNINVAVVFGDDSLPHEMSRRSVSIQAQPQTSDSVY